MLFRRIAVGAFYALLLSNFCSPVRASGYTGSDYFPEGDGEGEFHGDGEQTAVQRSLVEAINLKLAELDAKIDFDPFDSTRVSLRSFRILFNMRSEKGYEYKIILTRQVDLHVLPESDETIKPSTIEVFLVITSSHAITPLRLGSFRVEHSPFSLQQLKRTGLSWAPIFENDDVYKRFDLPQNFRSVLMNSLLRLLATKTPLLVLYSGSEHGLRVMDDLQADPDPAVVIPELVIEPVPVAIEPPANLITLEHWRRAQNLSVLFGLAAGSVAAWANSQPINGTLIPTAGLAALIAWQAEKVLSEKSPRRFAGRTLEQARRLARGPITRAGLRGVAYGAGAAICVRLITMAGL